MPGDIEFYLEEIRRAGSLVFELGCGTGRLLELIAREGFNVVGLDRAPSMLKIARAEVALLPPDVSALIEIVDGDMRAIALNRQFKLAIIPYRAFLHLLTVQDHRAALASIHEHLEDGGRLAFNIFDPDLEMVVERSSDISDALTRLTECETPETGRKIVVWDSRRYDLERQIVTEYRIFEALNPDGVVVKKTYTPLILRWV